MLGGALVFSRGSKSERHLRKKINPAVTHSAVADPANSRHLKKSLEARHLPGEACPTISVFIGSFLLSLAVAIHHYLSRVIRYTTLLAPVLDLPVQAPDPKGAGDAFLEF